MPIPTLRESDPPTGFPLLSILHGSTEIFGRRSLTRQRRGLACAPHRTRSAFERESSDEKCDAPPWICKTVSSLFAESRETWKLHCTACLAPRYLFSSFFFFLVSKLSALPPSLVVVVVVLTSNGGREWFCLRSGDSTRWNVNFLLGDGSTRWVLVRRLLSNSPPNH